MSATRWNLNKIESDIARFNTHKVKVILCVKVYEGFLPGIPDDTGSAALGNNFNPPVIGWVV